ncbi:MAG: amino acid ABC transporter ATP-binding protein [Planctomycetes bacterium]|nr:amino acid ABC transporter ATP-binding protein [Planctomycetota bacterium]
MIETRGLGKHYGSLSVLADISLTVQRGEVAVIVGPSGGGKSTFLRCLNGLEQFDAGEVEIGGLRLRADAQPRQAQSHWRHVRRRVGMVFQQFNLFPHRTVLGNVIEAPIHVLRQPREEAINEARSLLERVGLGDKLYNMPDTLSGGQQQRVAIARALAMRPEAILFDEPTSALDPVMSSEVESVIADLAGDGQTMIVVTHSMGFARRTAHTMYVFGGGGILEFGPPEQIFESPREAATKAFLSETSR